MSQLTDQIDATLTAYLPAIQAKQAAFLAQFGHYFQGLPSCSVVPADGSNAVIDQWDSAPAYQGVSWRTAWGGNPPTMQARLAIDQYLSPTGPGWQLTAEVIQAGVLWRRVVNFGPESYRTQAWTAVVQESRV